MCVQEKDVFMMNNPSRCMWCLEHLLSVFTLFLKKCVVGTLGFHGWKHSCLPLIVACSFIGSLSTSTHSLPYSMPLFRDCSFDSIMRFEFPTPTICAFSHLKSMFASLILSLCEGVLKATIWSKTICLNSCSLHGFQRDLCECLSEITLLRWTVYWELICTLSWSCFCCHH